MSKLINKVKNWIYYNGCQLIIMMGNTIGIWGKTICHRSVYGAFSIARLTHLRISGMTINSIRLCQSVLALDLLPGCWRSMIRQWFIYYHHGQVWRVLVVIWRFDAWVFTSACSKWHGGSQRCMGDPYLFINCPFWGANHLLFMVELETVCYVPKPFTVEMGVETTAVWFFRKGPCSGEWSSAHELSRGWTPIVTAIPFLRSGTPQLTQVYLGYKG